jgi:hypothetical protein
MIDAHELYRAARQKYAINLSLLIAATAVWANPQAHFRQIEKAGTAAVFPGIRRSRPGEKRGVKDGIGLDDNTYANVAIKRALGRHRTETIGFECCHIWPSTCYDARYHTAIANIVLIPRSLASLTDYDPEIQAALQYRAFELYNWYPSEAPQPRMPVNYPDNWLEPQPLKPSDNREYKSTSQTKQLLRRTRESSGRDPQKVNAPIALHKLEGWAKDSNLKVHRVISVVSQRVPSSRDQLVKELEKRGICKDPYGTIASLMTSKGNSYGLVLVENSLGRIDFHPDIKDAALKLPWSAPGA